MIFTLKELILTCLLKVYDMALWEEYVCVSVCVCVGVHVCVCVSLCIYTYIHLLSTTLDFQLQVYFKNIFGMTG